MQTLSSDEVRRIILQSYNQDPLGWEILLGKDVKGSFTTLFQQRTSRKDDAWLLKEEYVTPFHSVGVGAKLSRAELQDITPHSFGFRPLSEEQSKGLMSLLQETPTLPGGQLEEFLKISPSPTTSLEGKMIMHGPIAFTPRPIDLVSESARELDSKLSLELDKLVTRNFPEHRMRYV